MATEDLTRGASGFSRHYTGVRHQQGRVLTDDDFNAAGRAAAEELQAHNRDIIGPFGSPDQGFRISDAQAGPDGPDFLIEAGRIYLGGLRFDLLESERFHGQKDWLNQSAWPTPVAGQVDLVYLEGWQQSVSAVEDAELLEPGLGGPDTTTRVRNMKRVRLFSDVGTETCEEAWNILQTEWADSDVGLIDENRRLAPDTRLRVTYSEAEVTDDLCRPAIAGGYLGADNQTIRVQIVDGTHFTWGFHNAAPLFRIEPGEDSVTLTLVTVPKDPSLWPKAGQVIEILPWSAVLENGEKLAEELEPGFLTRLASDFNPDSRTVTLSAALPAGFGEAYLSRPDKEDLEKTKYGAESPQTPYLFLRIWDRGSDTLSDPAIAIGAGPQSLGTTGVAVEFLGDDRVPCDHWIISVRPETPDQVWPWKLEAERSPEGYARYIAPLALIRWAEVGEALVGDVIHDCRRPFRPLTELKGCCTVTVGDGTTSFGDFTSIQEAVNSLPASGGKVCIRPGHYIQEVHINGRADIILEGCGERTHWEAPPEAEAVLTLLNFQDCAVRDLRISHATGRCVHAEGLQTQAGPLELAGLVCVGRDQTAVFGWNLHGLHMHDCRVSIQTLEKRLDEAEGAGLQPAVLVRGTGLLLENNAVRTEAATSGQTALGGIQIGGGSEQVDLRRNTVEGGTGNGITLGHVVFVEEAQWGEWASIPWLTYDPIFTLGHIELDEKGCWIWVPDPGGYSEDPDQPEMVPVSGGDLREVRLWQNRIVGMGANGIAVARFFDLEKHPDFITVDALLLDENHIEGCLQSERSPYPPELIRHAAYGGIVLADGEHMVLRRNTIRDNGFSHEDPICGIFILSGDGVELRENRIFGNGPRGAELGALKRGHRGGIVLPLVRPRAEIPTGLSDAFLRQDGLAAAVVENNRVVAIEGKALKLMAIGPVAITHNQFTSHGSDLRELLSQFAGSSDTTGLSEASSGGSTVMDFFDVLGGTVVSATNLGMSMELYLQFLGLGGYMVSDELLDLDGSPGTDSLKLLANGNLQFHGNQVDLDAIDNRFTLGLSAVLLLTLDDLDLSDNQIECALLTDFIFVNTLALAWSLRCRGNRFKEGALNALLSAATFGLFNQTALNQGTHCFLAVGLPSLSVTEPNSSLADVFSTLSARGGCETWKKLSATLSETMGGLLGSKD